MSKKVDVTWHNGKRRSIYQHDIWSTIRLQQKWEGNTSSVIVVEVVERQHECYDILAGRKHTLGKKPDKITTLNSMFTPIR